MVKIEERQSAAINPQQWSSIIISHDKMKDHLVILLYRNVNFVFYMHVLRTGCTERVLFTFQDIHLYFSENSMIGNLDIY